MLQKTVAITLSSFGIYASYIAIFTWFCNRAMVKLTNLKLSIFQMLLRYISITLLEQERPVCFHLQHYLLKLICQSISLKQINY